MAGLGIWMCYLRGSSVEDFCNGRCIQCLGTRVMFLEYACFLVILVAEILRSPTIKFYNTSYYVHVFSAKIGVLVYPHVYCRVLFARLRRGFHCTGGTVLPPFFMVCSSTIFIKVCGPRHFALSGSDGRSVYRLWGSIFLHFVFLCCTPSLVYTYGPRIAADT